MSVVQIRPNVGAAKAAFSITPSDTANTALARALYVGTAGNLKVTTVDGDDVTFASISGFVPVEVTRVYSTGTTATNIVGLN